MSPRYVVRRAQNDKDYTVWDTEKQEPAISAGRECVHLGFDEALDTADLLNRPGVPSARCQPTTATVCG